MTILLRYVGLLVLAVCLLAPRVRAQSQAGACLPVDELSKGLRDGFAADASDRTAHGAERRALYHLPAAKDQQVRQETADAQCAKAIDAIRASRDDGNAPSRVYLFRVKNVWVIVPGTNTPFNGAVWTFDASMQHFLGGVLQ